MLARKPRILCIDDRVESLRVRSMLLERFGCDTFAAEDHNSAMRILSENEIDLLIIDYHLAAGKSGEEVARDVRALRPGMPIIMLSGDTRLPESVYNIVDEVMLKGSSDPRKLLDTIQRLLPEAAIRPLHPVNMNPPKAA